MIKGSYNNSALSEKIVLNVQEGHQNGIRIYGAEGSKGSDPYSLSISNVLLDTYEPNNSSSTAYGVNPGQSYESYIPVAGDEDWYTFTASETGKVEVQVQVPAGKDRPERSAALFT